MQVWRRGWFLVKQDRHQIGIEKQNVYLRSAPTGRLRCRRFRIISMKASTSEGSPSSDGAKSRTGDFSPGMNTAGSGRLPGLTTFAMTMMYRNLRWPVHSELPTARAPAGTEARRPEKRRGGAANVTSAVRISPIAAWRSTRLAGSPINADSNKTLASAASFTANLPPGFEVGEDLFFGPAVLPDLPSNLGAQHVEKLALHVDRERPFRSRKKHSRHSSTASDQDGHLGLQQRGRVIAQLPNRADSHVATLVTIIGCGDLTPLAFRGASVHHRTPLQFGQAHG